MIEFAPAEHTYTIGGRPLISVTQAMKESGLIDTRWFTEWAAQRGSRIHRAVQLLCEDDLDEESVDFNDRPYLEAYKKFAAEKNWRPFGTELHVWDEGRGFAGTLDGVGDLDRKATIVDYKTGPPTRAVGIQLTGYAIALKATSGQIAQRLVAVHLKPDGNYRMTSYAFEPTVFLACLTVAQWKGAA